MALPKGSIDVAARKRIVACSQITNFPAQIN